MVLDNAEDPIRGDRGGVRALVGTLVRECRGLSFLLATRELLGKLDAATEHEVHVGQLSKGDARAVFLSVAGERLSLEERGSAELDGLLAWVDGHPLSLVLVARQVGTMRLPELLRRLERKGVEAVHAEELFGEEATGGRDERLTRLASSLSLSYQPLAEKVPGAAEMFAWLGHFPAGLPEGLVPRIFGEDGAEQRAILLRRGLAEEVGRERRLLLPAPVRAYARGRAGELTEGRRAELVEASFGAMAGWMDALYERMGKPGAREAMDTAARDAENVSGLLAAVPANGEGREALAEGIASTVWAFAQVMLYGGRAQAAVAIARDALASVERVARGAPYGRGPLANVLQALGDLYVRTDRLKDAEAAYGQALPQFRAIDERLGEANVLKALGDLYVRTDRLEDAEAAYGQALPQFRAIDARLGEANVLMALGDLYVRTARLKDAEAAYGQALPQFRAIDERLGEANVLKALGDLYVRTARLKDAEAAYGQALPQFRAIDERLGEANVLQALGDLYVRTARLEDAEAAYGQALPQFRAIDARLGEANVLKALGDLYVRTDRLEDAEAAYGQALPQFRAIDERLGEANVLKALGDLYVRTARLKDAEAAYGQALPQFRAIDERLGEANVLQALGDLYVRTARLKDAEAAYGQALPQFRAIDARLGEANVLKALGDLYVRTDRLEDAEAAYGQALPQFRAIDERLGEANALKGMGNLARARDDAPGAFQRYLEALDVHRQIDDQLGVAGDHVYLARASLVAGRLVRAVVLLATGLRFFAGQDDHFDIILTGRELARAFAGLNKQEEASAAMLIAWSHAATIDHPLAHQLAEQTGQPAPTAEAVQQAEALLATAISTCEQDLAASGEDPYSPLPPRPSATLPE